jgi:hypothetical protein
MSIEFCGTQFVILSEAAPRLAAGAARKVSAKLIEANLLGGVMAKPEVTRRDVATRQLFVLKLTAAERKAVRECVEREDDQHKSVLRWLRTRRGNRPTAQVRRLVGAPIPIANESRLVSLCSLVRPANPVPNLEARDRL